MVLLVLPENVRQTVEEKIDEKIAAVLVIVLAEYYLGEFQELYSLISNEFEKAQEKHIERMKRHEFNFWAFIQTITKLHGEADIESANSDSDAESACETPLFLEHHRTPHRGRENSEARGSKAHAHKTDLDLDSSDEEDADREKLDDVKSLLQKAQKDRSKICYAKADQSDEEKDTECEIRKKRMDLLMEMAQKKKKSAAINPLAI